MPEITVERRPGGPLLVTGLLARPEMVDVIAALLVEPELLEVAVQLAEYDRARMDAPEGSIADGLYQDAFGELSRLLAAVLVEFRSRDLEPIADAVAAERDRGLVTT